MSSEDSPTEPWIARLVDGEPLDWLALERALGPRSAALARMRRVAVLCAAMAADPPDPVAGQAESDPGFQWGHLRVGALLGRGSSGAVYRAFDTVLQRDVALKLFAGEGVAARAFIAEARRLAQVRHGNVLAVHGAAVHDGRAGLWAELVSGRSLREWVGDEGERPAAEVLAVAQSLASALAAVHGAGLVHGDVKPANVMRADGDGHIVLMDFGSADSRQGAGRGGLLGSPLSMAPEQARGDPVGPPADMYGLGVVMYYLLSARLPAMARPGKQATGGPPAPPARASAAELPASAGCLRPLLVALLDSDPDRRPDAAAVCRQLHRIVAAPRRRRRMAAVAVTIGALVLGLGASLFALQSVRQERQIAEVAQIEQAAVSDFLVDLLASPIPARRGADVQVRDVLDQAVADLSMRFDQHPAARVRLLRTLSNSYQMLGLWQQAHDLTHRALGESISVHGADSEFSLDLESRLADLGAKLTTPEQAEQELQRVLQRARSILGPGHRISVYLLLELADLHANLDRNADARELAQAALALRPPGVLDSQRQSAMSALGQIEYGLGNLEEAEALYRQALAEIPADHAGHGQRSNAFAIRNNLAIVLKQRGELAATEREFRLLLEQAQSLYGDDHPSTRKVLANLGGILNEQSQFGRALPHLQRAWTLVQRHESEGSLNRLMIQTNLANALVETGAPDQARALREDGYRASLAALGAGHPQTLIMQNNLAEQRLLDGDGAGAERLAEAMAEQARIRFGGEHLFALEAGEVAIRARFAQGQRTLALGQLRDQCRRKREFLGQGHPYHLSCRLHLAQALVETRQQGPARNMLESALQDSVAAHGATHPLSRRIETRLAGLAGS